jgi:hypothetical protein
MSRTREVLRNGVWYQIDTEAPLPPRKTPYIMRDISDYRSAITGETITSRSAHRDHLRAHNCVEVGNEMPRNEAPDLPPIRDDLIRAAQASPEMRAEAATVARAAAAVE